MVLADVLLFDRPVPEPSEHLWYIINSFARIVFRDLLFTNTPRYQIAVATHREHYKTVLANWLLTYLMLYDCDTKLSVFLSASQDNARASNKFVSENLSMPEIVADYSPELMQDSADVIVSKFNNACMSRTFEQYQRGLHHDGTRCQFLVIDDPETVRTVSYPRQMSNIWEKYTGEIDGSLAQSGCITLVLMNMLSPYGLANRFVKSADEKIVIPLWTESISDPINKWLEPHNADKIKKSLTWKKRYSWNGGDGKLSVKKMIERSIKIQEYGGEPSFRSEYLCDPLAIFGSYYDIPEVEKYSVVREPKEVVSIRGIQFHIYSDFVSDGSFYICGMDFGLGAGADATTLIVLKLVDGHG